MSEQDIERYIELKNIISDNAKEMKPLKKELKELEQLIIDSGKTEITHYGVKLIITEKETEKMNKEEINALISKELHSNNGDGLEYTDFFEPVKRKKIKITDVELDQNNG